MRIFSAFSAATVNTSFGVFFHDIYVDNTAAGAVPLVQIENRDGIVATNVQGAGPLTLPAGRAGDAVRIVGGSDIEVNYYDSVDSSGVMSTEN